MSMLGGVGSSGMVMTESKMRDYSNPISPWSNGMDVSGPSMSNVPYAFYKLFLGKDYEKNNIICYSSPDTLDKMAQFIQDPKLKKEIYSNIRNRIFNNNGHSRSIIVNEIMGACSMVKKVALYGLATFKMHR